MFDRFRDRGEIALGHLDCVDLDQTDQTPCQLDYETINRLLSEAHKKLGWTKGRTESHITQANTFINYISPGDWVITRKGNNYILGRILTSASYTKDSGHGTFSAEHYETYHLSRKVYWGASFKRHQVPDPLATSLKANQTVTSIDRHYLYIYHLLYQAFRIGHVLYLSAEIQQQKEVNAYYLSKFFSFLADVEIFAKEFDEHFDFDFDELVGLYLTRNEPSITASARFESPGSIWAKLGFSISEDQKKRMAYAVLAYSMLFGNSFLGMDGVLDKELRHKMFDLLKERIHSQQLYKTRDKLLLRSQEPSADIRMEFSVHDENGQPLQEELIARTTEEAKR